MIPKRVTLENFLSFGPKTEIEFTDDEPIWVLGGANGSGKSAVFDAMTFALFGEHRGGAKNTDSLVRHGTNGFAIAFEFEFGGIDYQIVRNSVSRANTSLCQKLKSQKGWTRIPNVNTAAQIKGWTERTLGLTFDAFKASVMLRQGEADRIVEAKGTERLNILKKIIGAERYEALSDRVHEETKDWKGKYVDLQTELTQRNEQGRGKIAEEQLAEAAASVKVANNRRTEAQAAELHAREAVGLAKRWSALSTRDNELRLQIQEADMRAANAGTIRTDKAELDQLSSVIPVLRNLIAMRARIAITEQSRGELDATLERSRSRIEEISESLSEEKESCEKHRVAKDDHHREAMRIRDEADRDSKLGSVAEAAAAIQKELNAFARDLDRQLIDARERSSTASEAAIGAGNKKAEIGALLKQARAREKEFDKVGVGVKCARCGQKVSASHAKEEREEIASEIRALEKRFRDAGKADTSAAEEASAADTARTQVEALVNDRNAKVAQLAHHQMTLNEFGITIQADQLRLAVGEKYKEADGLDARAAEEARLLKAAADEARRLEAEHKSASAERDAAAARLRTCEQQLGEENGQRRALVVQLASEWQQRVDSLGAAETEKLEDRRRDLVASDVEQQFKQLQEDAARRDEWVKQSAEIKQQLDEIPQAARVASADAEANERAAKQASIEADHAWQDAKSTEETLRQQAEYHNKLVDGLAKAERQFDLHKKLNELLGKKGIQRELVRGAEAEIVQLANDTVQKLSNGDLSLELDSSADSDDEAFELLVQQADKPEPTEVLYLSGSEKFRVSVAIALAIGRYATGKTRPLESVIIDEGFGSLDRDGLEAARTELKRLSTFLRRIILVSHQEDFANDFPVIIQLKRGAEGTTATTVRR